MSEQIERLAYSVLLPAVADLEPAALTPLLDRGCRAALLGETRDEYVARAMSPDRIASESAEKVRETIATLRERAPAELIVAVDHEVVGIRRFAHLLPPDGATAPAAVREAAAAAGSGLRELGVNVVLGPIVDVIRGENPWLSGRNLGPDPAAVATAGRAAVDGLQASGVATVAKHYPGHAVLADDPAVSLAIASTPLEELDGPDELPFAAVVSAGARGIMLGPAVIEAIDASEAASCSAILVRRARERLGFRGALVSDDLDAAGVLRGRQVGDVAVAAIAAGVDLLLVGAHLAGECAAALATAVAAGRISPERLAEASGQVGRLAPSA